MTYINPLAAAFAQSSQVQRAQADDKTRQLRRAQTLRRNSATPSDEPQHEVESTDTVILQSEEEEKKEPRKKRPPKKKNPTPNTPDTPPALDIVA